MPSPTRTIARSACRLIRTARRIEDIAAELRAAGHGVDAEAIRRKAAELADIGRRINGANSLEAELDMIARALKAHDRQVAA